MSVEVATSPSIQPPLIKQLKSLGKYRNEIWRFPCTDDSRKALDYISRLAREAAKEEASFTKNFVSDFLSRKSAKPEFVDSILAWLDGVDGKVEDFGEVLSIIGWVCQELSDLRGISIDQLLQAVECTGNGNAMDDAGLKHVSEKLASLDDTGRAKYIWPHIQRKCRLVRNDLAFNLADRVRTLAQQKPGSRELVLSQVKDYISLLKAEIGSSQCLPFDRFNNESTGPGASSPTVTIAEKCAVLVANHDAYFAGDDPLLAHADFDGPQLAAWLSVVRHVKDHVDQHVELVGGWYKDVLAYLRGVAQPPKIPTATVADASTTSLVGEPPKKPIKKATVNMRMADTIQRKPEAMEWTVTDWQKELKCSRSPISGAETWTNLESYRQTQRASRRNDKRRRPRKRSDD